MTSKFCFNAALAAALSLSLAACSGGGSNSRIDYGETDSTPSLEVPPELSVPVDTGVEKIPSFSTEGGGDGAETIGILPHSPSIRIARDGSTRWLVIDMEASKLWPKLMAFWESVGLELNVADRSVGIMETVWAENHADAPGGFLADMIKSVFKSAYEAGTRDKYRLRLEPVGEGRTELYITHYGLKEVVASQNEEIVETAWQVRPSDPELANEIKNRLVLYLGGAKQTAEAVVDAKPIQDSSRARISGDALLLDEGFARGWRLTGLALDRIGLVVEDRNRSEGIYYVSHVDQLADAGLREKSWFGSLFSGEEGEEQPKQWQVHLSGDDTTTRIRFRDKQGGAVPEELSRSILEKLQEALR